MMNNMEKLASALIVKQAMILDSIPDHPSRQFSDEEEQDLRQAKRTALRGPFASTRDPATKRLVDPKKRALLAALALGGMGAGYGGLAGAVGGNASKGALIGGLLAGLPAAAIGSTVARRTNEDIEDALSRLPPGATIRDLEREPLYRDRLMRGAVVAGRS